MLSVEDALARVRAAFGPLPPETVSVADALGSHGLVKIGETRPARPFRRGAPRGWLRIARRHRLYVELGAPRLRTYFAQTEPRTKEEA